jgi:hypothetical protein
VDPKFIEAMETGLAHGREQGRTGWDTNWAQWMDDATTYSQVFEGLIDKLEEERHEFLDAVRMGLPPDQVRREAADVANIAMMLSDLIAIGEPGGYL